MAEYKYSQYLAFEDMINSITTRYGCVEKQQFTYFRNIF
jgi:hypothetical protein